MNAIWFNKIFFFKNSSLALQSAQSIISLKIKSQKTLLRKYKVVVVENLKITEIKTLQGIMLEEGRFAKKYWKEFANLIPQNINFKRRRPRQRDIVNRLLDIGYHHIKNIIVKILKRYKVPQDIGFLHVAKTSQDLPLVYDLMEMFRVDLVDVEVLRFLRLKKRKFIILEERDISHFLYEVNGRLARLYYIKDLKRCYTYYEYMELQVLNFIKAINHKKKFDPIQLPTRHESRCKVLTNE